MPSQRRHMQTLKRRSLGYDNDEYLNIIAWRITISNDYHLVIGDTNNYVKRDNGVTFGYDIPNFHRRRRKGELLPCTPFRQFRTNGSTKGVYDFYTPVYYYKISEPGRNSHMTDWVVTEEMCAAELPTTYDVYVQEAAARIYGQGHDTLTFLAELSDVHRMFENVGKRLLRFPDLIPRKSWKEIMKGTSSDWLQYRYGWRTLSYDLQDLNKALQDLDNGIKRYSERCGNTYRTSRIEEWETTVTGIGTRYHAYEDLIEVGVRGTVTADVKIPKFQFNPLQTGWELIPFSFVLDWFVSVGKALSAISFLSLAPTYVASAGQYVKITRSYRYDMGNWSTGCGGVNYQEGTCEAELSVRQPTYVSPIPRLKLRLNSLKILDLLSMIAQRKR